MKRKHDELLAESFERAKKARQDAETDGVLPGKLLGARAKTEEETGMHELMMNLKRKGVLVGLALVMWSCAEAKAADTESACRKVQNLSLFSSLVQCDLPNGVKCCIASLGEAGGISCVVVKP